MEDLPKQRKIPPQIPLNREEAQAVSCEIPTLLHKGVIVPTVRSGNDFFSTVFTRKKSIGYRMILNLKRFNDYVEYKHFKMATAQTAIQLLTPFCWQASLDISDAYYSLKMAKNHSEYLKFQWQGKMYKFVAMPNGLACGPRKWTKLMKPVFATLAKMGYLYVGYIDDSWTMDSEKQLCTQSIFAGKTLMERLGFLVNYTKSVFVPTQVIEFLGLILDSIKMMVFLTTKKTNKILQLCIETIARKHLTIRELAKLIGNLVAALPAAQYGQMHYRTLERLEIQALKVSHGNWDAICTLEPKHKLEIQWWIDNVQSLYKPILLPPVQATIYTDASGYAWGASLDAQSANNYFSDTEIEFSINTKELLAIKYALRCFRTELQGLHVLIRSDNTTAISYVKNMGGTKHGLRNEIAKDIWDFAIEHSMWLSISHIPGVENVSADTASRVLHNPRTEWALRPNVFAQITHKLGSSEIDLFASMLNNKLPRYMSLARDPYSEYVDAFTLDWSDLNAYIFPPFSVMTRVVQKINRDQPKHLTIVYPRWHTQPWWAALQKTLAKNQAKTITLPKNSLVNPVNPKANMPEHTVLLASKF